MTRHQIDFSRIHSDDAYVDYIGGAIDPVPADDLAELLIAWRNDVGAEPIRDLITQYLAVATEHTAKARRESA